MASDLGDGMSIDQQQVRAFVQQQGEHWNSGDREAFDATYRAIAPKGFRVEFPVGQPPKDGSAVMDQLWAGYQGKMFMSYPVITFGGDHEFAVIEKVDAPADGEVHTHHTIHSYVLRDGELLVRYFTDAAPATAATDTTRDFLTRQYDHWNANERDPFFAAYEAFTGDRFDVEFPVGTPPNPGTAVLEQLWQGYNATTKLRYQMVVVAESNEAAVWVANTREVDGKPHVNNSIEFYSVRDDGLHIRYFHEGH